MIKLDLFSRHATNDSPDIHTIVFFVVPEAIGSFRNPCEGGGKPPKLSQSVRWNCAVLRGCCRLQAFSDLRCRIPENLWKGKHAQRVNKSRVVNDPLKWRTSETYKSHFLLFFPLLKFTWNNPLLTNVLHSAREICSSSIPSLEWKPLKRKKRIRTFLIRRSSHWGGLSALLLLCYCPAPVVILLLPCSCPAPVLVFLSLLPCSCFCSVINHYLYTFGKED